MALIAMPVGTGSQLSFAIREHSGVTSNRSVFLKVESVPRLNTNPDEFNLVIEIDSRWKIRPDDIVHVGNSREYDFGYHSLVAGEVFAP